MAVEVLCHIQGCPLSLWDEGWQLALLSLFRQVCWSCRASHTDCSHTPTSPITTSPQRCNKTVKVSVESSQTLHCKLRILPTTHPHTLLPLWSLVFSITSTVLMYLLCGLNAFGCCGHVWNVVYQALVLEGDVECCFLLLQTHVRDLHLAE